jgi:acetyltransferase-like isoleucine patch superfamily enzyme
MERAATPVLICGTGAVAANVTLALLARGHQVAGLIDDSAPDPRKDGRTKVVRGIKGAPDETLQVLPVDAWVSMGALRKGIVVVVPEGNRAEETEAAVRRVLELIELGGKAVVGFNEICQNYPECGIRPSSWFQVCRSTLNVLKTHPNISMGFKSYFTSAPLISEYTKGITESRLVVGAFSSIAEGAKIVLVFGGHSPDWGTTFPFPAIMPDITSADPVSREKIGVTIGSDVWIGREVTILPGVHIGHGAIIGAGSIVSRDVAPYSVTTGNPARHRRYRFPERERAALLQACWWDWPWEEIQRVSPLLCSPELGECLRSAAARPGAAQSGALARFASRRRGLAWFGRG